MELIFLSMAKHDNSPQPKVVSFFACLEVDVVVQWPVGGPLVLGRAKTTTPGRPLLNTLGDVGWMHIGIVSVVQKGSNMEEQGNVRIACP